MTTPKKLVKNTTMLFSADVIGRVLSFLLFIMIARVLGDEGLGKYSFIFAFVNFVGLFSDFGISTLLVRELSRDKSHAKRYFGTLLSFKAILAFITVPICIISILFVNTNPDVTFSIILLSVGLVFYYLRDFNFVLFQSFEVMKYQSITVILERIIVVGLGILVLFLGYGIRSLVGVFIISYFITFIFAFVVSEKKIVPIRLYWDVPFVKKFFKESIPFWLTSVFIIIYFSIDTIMLGIMKDYVVVGWYNAAYRALDALYFIPGAVVTAVYPVMSRYSISNVQGLKDLFERIFSYLFIIAFPIGVGTTLLAGRIISFVYGSDFTRSVPALQILIWAEVIIFLSSISGYLLNAINKQKLFTIITAGSAFINVILNLILIPKFSYLGASVATVVTEVFVLVGLLIFAAQSGFLIRYRYVFLKPIISGILMGIAIWYLAFLHVFVLIVVGAILYFVFLFIMGGIGQEEIALVKHLLQKND